MAPLIAAAAWAIGIAAAAALYARLLGTTPGGGPRGVAEAVVAGWVLQGVGLVALALAGVAVNPVAAMAPVVVLLVLALRRTSRNPESSNEASRRDGSRPEATDPRKGHGVPGFSRSTGGSPAASRPRDDDREHNPIPAGATARGTPPGETGAVERWLAPAVLLAGAVRLGLHLARWPWGQPWSWDVYAVWGLKARFLVGTGGLWRYLGVAGRYPFSHGDYPLLLPSHLAAVSWPEGRGFLAALPDAVLCVSALVLVHELLRRRIGRMGAACAALLIVWPANLWGGHLVGLADRPLAMLAGTAVALLLTGEAGSRLLLTSLVLCGMGLVKNEGLLLAVLLAAAWAMVERSRRIVAAAALSLAPPLAWLATMTALGLRSDRLVAPQFGRDLSAHAPELAKALVALVWQPDLAVPVLAATAGVLVGLATGRRRWVALALSLQALALATTVVLGPYEIVWQLSTALPRLLVGPLPAAIVCFAMLADRRPAPR